MNTGHNFKVYSIMIYENKTIAILWYSLDIREVNKAWNLDWSKVWYVQQWYKFLSLSLNDKQKWYHISTMNFNILTLSRDEGQNFNFISTMTFACLARASNIFTISLDVSLKYYQSSTMIFSCLAVTMILALQWLLLV